MNSSTNRPTERLRQAGGWEGELPGDSVVDASHLTTVWLEGGDVQTFLQGQLTVDVAELEGRHRLAAFCNPKGRAMSVVRLWRAGKRYALQLPAELKEQVVQRLRMYVLRSDVQFQDGEDTLSLGLGGRAALDWLASRIGVLPGEGEVRSANGWQVLGPPPHSPRVQLTGPRDELDAWFDDFPNDVPWLDQRAWLYQDIAAGLPEVWQATSEAFIPQMLNLDLLSGISFNKGCYTGQEIVARMHYLGNLKKRMFRLHCDAGDNVAPGAKIFAGGEQSAGAVVSGVRVNDGHHLLAVLQLKHAESETLNLFSPDGPRLTWRRLPYQSALSAESEPSPSPPGAGTV